MPIRIYRACKLCLILLLLTFLATLILSQTARGQGLELHGGWFTSLGTPEWIV